MLHKVYTGRNVKGDERTLDIILVPGNHTANVLSWVDPHDQVFWVQKVIEEVGVAAQVWAYIYQGINDKSSSHDAWFEEGGYLLQALEVLPPTASGRAQILFIAHSFGGFVVKSALGKAATANLWLLFPQIKGIVFLSSPHLKSRHRSSNDINDRLTLIGKTFTPPMSVITLMKFDLDMMTWACDTFDGLRALTCLVVCTVEDVVTPLQFKGIFGIKQTPKKILVDNNLGAIEMRQNTLNIVVHGKTHADTCRLDQNDQVYHEIKRLLW